MKKTLILCFMLLMLVSCSSEKPNNEAPNNETSNETSQENNEIDHSDNNAYSDWDTYHMSVGDDFGVVYYDGPGWGPAEIGTSREFTPSADCCVLFTGCLENLDGNDLFETATKEALFDMNSIVTADFVETSMRENKKINSYDTIHFAGNIHDTKKDRDMYITGYVFEYAGAACGVFGIVYDKNLPQDLIDLVNETTDHMITTVRDSE